MAGCLLDRCSYSSNKSTKWVAPGTKISSTNSTKQETTKVAQLRTGAKFPSSNTTRVTRGDRRTATSFPPPSEYSTVPTLRLEGEADVVPVAEEPVDDGEADEGGAPRDADGARLRRASEQQHPHGFWPGVPACACRGVNGMEWWGSIRKLQVSVLCSPHDVVASCSLLRLLGCVSRKHHVLHFFQGNQNRRGVEHEVGCRSTH
jgi:hypothetical protein